ncbi:MAG: glycosyltransferase family protein [Rhodospirillaceae bacterium]|nr:glycosyltransferase family protein [Rhodospirillaceae bacterium]
MMDEDESDWQPAADASPTLLSGLDALAGGHLDAAATTLARAPEANHDPHVVYRIGVAQSLSGNPNAAIASWRRTLRLDAAFAPALYDLALAYMTTGDIPQATLTFSRLIDFFPDHAEGRFNFGNLLFRIGRTEDAVAMYAPLTDSPDPPRGILVNLGRALRRLGRLTEADACYRRALLSDPNDHFTHWNRAHVLFLMERWTEGFAAWEHRLHAGMGPPETPNLPEWTTGDPPSRLLLIGEQGHGDALQCLRYVSPLITRRASPILALHPALAPLVRVLLPEISVFAFSEISQITADAWAPLFSLPHRLALPAPDAVPEPATQDTFATGLGTLRAAAPDLGLRPRVGLAWAGNPKHDNDHWRSMALDNLSPLIAARPDISWISLQVGAAAAQAPLCPTLQNLPPPADFLETAHTIVALDLVITVDTAVAHVAGCLGIPTWIMLAAEPDWRWGPTDTTTPWYASARLFRQATLGDWAPVVATIGTALACSLPTPDAEKSL